MFNQGTLTITSKQIPNIPKPTLVAAADMMSETITIIAHRMPNVLVSVTDLDTEMRELENAAMLDYWAIENLD